MIPGTRHLLRTTAGVSTVLALLVAVLPPAAYFAVSYQYAVGRLDAQAEISARTCTALVTANPRTWLFEEVRLSELLERNPLAEAPQVRRVVDLGGALVAEHAVPLSPPVVSRSRPIFDAGAPAGRIEISESLAPMVLRTAFVALGATLAAAGFYAALGVLPRRVAEKALRAFQDSERRYRSLFQSMKEGVGLFRVSGEGEGAVPRIEALDVNTALETMLGRPRGDLLGGGVSDVLGARFADHVLAVAGGARGREPEAFEVSRPESSRVFGITAFSPEPGLVAALVEDLTETRRAQQERDHLERKLFQAQKLESLGVLAGGIAHDFNNLLVGILGNAEFALAKSPPESEVRRFLQRIEAAGQRAAELTNQMLAYSGRGRFVVEPVDLSRLVGEMGQLLSTVVSKTAEVRYRLAPGLPPVEADATQLRQVVMNLLTNASDAIGDRDGTVTVTTGVMDADRAYLAGTHSGEAASAGRYAYVEVSDTGCGMDGATLARIFDPFFTTKQKGRGLGLAAALGIVRGHRGALRVASQPGGGTSFRVLFPVTEATPAGHPEASAAGPGPVPNPPLRGTVLVVDDEAEVRTVTKDLLEDLGYTVLTAADGREGLDVFRASQGSISAVVLDMTMPRMGGSEVFRELRAIAPTVPVVLCSGYTEQETADRVAGDAAAGFIQKPYRAKALADKLAELIGAPFGSG